MKRTQAEDLLMRLKATLARAEHGGRRFGPAACRADCLRLIEGAMQGAREVHEALVMVRDADEDCLRDGLPRIPTAARRKIDAALELYEA